MKIFLTIFSVLLFLTAIKAQELRTRTNEIHLAVTESRLRTTVPVINWISPILEYSNSIDREVEVVADVLSDVAINGIHIIIGDNAGGGLRGEKSVEISPNLYLKHIKQKIILQEGSNFIEIVVENVNGAKVSGIRNVMVGQSAMADAVNIDRKDYALLFATDTYDYWKNLVNPVYDANSIATELREKYGFEVEVVENATQEEILVKIKDYAKRNYKPQDQLVIFFAGHGQFDEGFGEGYVVAKNSLENDKAKTTYISHSNLRSYVNNISCKHILLTMDVCFGGTFDPAVAQSRGTEKNELTYNEFVARKLAKKTRQYITSGGKEYVSDGVVGKHSPFAACFLEALKGRGGEDQILTINEIVPYLEKIKQHEPQLGNFGDNEKGSDFIFLAKKN